MTWPPTPVTAMPKSEPPFQEATLLQLAAGRTRETLFRQKSGAQPLDLIAIAPGCVAMRHHLRERISCPLRRRRRKTPDSVRDICCRPTGQLNRALLVNDDGDRNHGVDWVIEICRCRR